ncbi:MAG: hypothetical protein AAFV46_00135 [Cyanobacteria bacterium J06635_11]
MPKYNTNMKVIAYLDIEAEACNELVAFEQALDELHNALEGIAESSDINIKNWIVEEIDEDNS